MQLPAPLRAAADEAGPVVPVLVLARFRRRGFARARVRLLAAAPGWGGAGTELEVSTERLTRAPAR